MAVFDVKLVKGVENNINFLGDNNLVRLHMWVEADRYIDLLLPKDMVI